MLVEWTSSVDNRLNVYVTEIYKAIQKDCNRLVMRLLEFGNGSRRMAYFRSCSDDTVRTGGFSNVIQVSLIICRRCSISHM